MKVQIKILLLLLVIVATFVGGLAALKYAEQGKFKAIADARARERTRMFDEFLQDRGDNLKAFIDDWTSLDDMVLAVRSENVTWAEQNISHETLVNFRANAVWIYKPDQTLFFSRNNHYATNLRDLPITPEAFAELVSKGREFHFFLPAPQGWMEIRGGTIHPSRDRARETTPQGWFFAGQTWIDTNIRKMSLFTGYSIRLLPASEGITQPKSEEDRGLIAFSRIMPGWSGQPAVQIQVEHDSPIIRELNRSSQRLFYYLMIFAGLLFLVLSLVLIRWVQQPLQLISQELESKNPGGLAALQRQNNEFGKLAKLILDFRRTEETLQQTEEQLRHSQKLEAVGRLAGGVAHDFNNLLTAIIGYSEMLEIKLKNDGTSCEQAKLIRKAGEQAAALTRQLLAFSRKQLLQPKVLDLNALIREMEKLLQRVIGEHIRIRIDPAAGDPRVLADPHQIEQVILNLGVNARDAMPRGGTLTITTSNVTVSDTWRDGEHELAAGEYVTLAVSDTGTGMDSDTKARIFEPFFTTKGPGKGTGLGLATVYGIVKQSGGGISVTTEPGQGSTFRIYLPRADAPIEAPKPAPLPIERTGNAESILVVEDEQVVRQLVCAVLAEAGYHVLCAGSPSEALTLVQAHSDPIHLLVTDVVMPEMHGPVLARALSVLQPAMKVLYVSGYSENDISDQGVVEPGLDVLQKPFTQEVLTRKVREILDGSPAGMV